MQRVLFSAALLLSVTACALEASNAMPQGDTEPTASAASAASTAIAGKYMFHIATPRGPEVGNWSLHADGTLYSVANGAELVAGAWTADTSTITIVRNTPYGNHCTYIAPRTASGFAAPESPSAQVTCTFNRLRPNPPTSWYATRLP